MSKIRIVAAPPGQAPDWVRQAWIGIEIPLLEEQEGGVLVGVNGGAPDPRSLNGYTVALEGAIDALRKQSPRAAEWWDQCLIAQLGQKLTFARDACLLLP